MPQISPILQLDRTLNRYLGTDLAEAIYILKTESCVAFLQVILMEGVIKITANSSCTAQSSLELQLCLSMFSVTCEKSV